MAINGFGQASKKAYEEASKIACESIASVRTIAVLAKEGAIIADFKRQCDIPHRISFKAAKLTALAYGVAEASPTIVWAISLYYGGMLVIWGTGEPKPILLTVFCLIFTASQIGKISGRAKSFADGNVAAASICDLLDHAPLIDVCSGGGEVRETISGSASISNVDFCYPTRPDVPILKNFTLDIVAGKTVALVGPSGSGKSTIVALLERWYDVNRGSASVDGTDVRNWNLRNLRSHMSLVGQEPALFNVSIRDNIAYGAVGACDGGMICDAAKLANIHHFIRSLPNGYDTLVGEKGCQLSGGQKQRIAIARALIRNPKMLLLDEATSALDASSEKAVQDALDVASKGRTTIVIAHRLATIQKADLILFVQKGLIVESGTHVQLLALKGEYFMFVSKQKVTMTPL